MFALIEKINAVVWGPPTLLLILSVGICLSLRTGFAQITLFPRAVKRLVDSFRSRGTGDGVSPFRALCTALAATVGTGNLAGVAGAIGIGGPGAIFWMWICGLLGMVIKFAEAALAVRYRTRNEVGEVVGGPMYMIAGGLGRGYHWLAAVYCFFGVVAAFGVGNATQINTVIGSINGVLTSFGVETGSYLNLFMGAVFALVVAILLSGGARRIGSTAERLVPFASLLYLLLCLGVLVVNASLVPQAFRSIIAGAFAPQAVTGGMIGSALQALRVGTARGVFTNEAGMGTAGIAHGSANASHPGEQGLLGIVEVFLDTIVICTMTALAILCSKTEVTYGVDAGVELTASAFSEVYGSWIRIPLALSICCFAFATILGWGLYGARCAQYLFGHSAWRPFVLLQAVTVVIGAVLGTGTVWLLAETVNGLMAVPNLITLLLLSPELARLTAEYKQFY